MLIDKCSCSIHFQLASAHCVIHLFLFYGFLPFVNKKIFMRLQCSVWDKEEKTKLNQMLIKMRGCIYYTWKRVWVQLMRKYKKMTVTRRTHSLDPFFSESPFLTLNNSVGNNWIYLLCIVVELSFSRSLVNEDAQSWYTILNTVSWSLFTQLFNFPLRNMHANWQ